MSRIESGARQNVSRHIVEGLASALRLEGREWARFLAVAGYFPWEWSERPANAAEYQGALGLGVFAGGVYYGGSPILLGPVALPALIALIRAYPKHISYVDFAGWEGPSKFLRPAARSLALRINQRLPRHLRVVAVPNAGYTLQGQDA